MWTIKILLVVISICVIGIRAEISGLQNNFNSGYSYDRPEAVPAELAYYQKIPANNLRPVNQYQQQHQHHHNHQNQQFNGGNVNQGHSHFHQPSVNQFVSHHHQFNEPTTNQYIPPEPVVPSLPFVQENSGFRPINSPPSPSPHQFQDLPFIRENTGLRLVNSPPHQFSSPYQHHHTFGSPQQNINHQNEIPQNTLNFLQNPSQNQNSASVLSGEKLRPPSTSFNTQQSTSQVSPLANHHQSNNNGFMASVTGSYNAPLPFPFGTVPIKFDPLPLKTHLRQERLLPITSYEAKEFYKK